MAYQLIIGGSGSGKTYECIKRISALDKAGENVIYIVPQQFTLEAENMLLSASNTGAIMRTRVLSFKRLAYVVMNGSDTHRAMLSPLGRIFLVRRLARENRDKLAYYSKVTGRNGFIDSLVNIMTEFYQYGIKPDMLADAAAALEDGDALKLKLNDLYIIYSAYREQVSKHYLASEESLDLLAENIKNSELIKNAHIFIDGIDYFIPQEYDVIGQLMLYSKEVTVTVCGSFKKPVSYSAFDPFYEQKRTVRRLAQIADETRCRALPAVCMEGCMRHADHPEFLHLFNMYFKSKPEKFKGVPENIHIVRAFDTDAELEAVCRRINGLVREKNYKYDDIAVIIDPSMSRAVKNKFSFYNIPVFIDSSRPVSAHPLTELVLCVLDILCRGIDTKRMLRYAKGIFSPADSEDVFYLENYVLKHGIDGGTWLKPEWSWGFSNRETDEDFTIINTAKNDCVESLAKISENLRRGREYDVKYIISEIYGFLFDIKVPETLDRLVQTALDEEDMSAFRQHSRIWDELKDIFTALADIYDRPTDIVSFADVFKSGIEHCSISIIPPTRDNIIVGDIDRSRIPGVKTVFILGAREGVIPPFTDDIGLLADDERTFLTDKFFELSFNNTRKINLTDHNIYNLMLKPTNSLYISCPRLDPNGKRAIISPVITRLLKLFPDMSEEEADISDMPPAPAPAFKAMLKDLREARANGAPSERLEREYAWFKDNAAYQNDIKMLRRVASDELSKRENSNFTLHRAELEKLYGGKVDGSVSCLESYAKCPFAYFLNYGLNIKRRDEYKFDMLRLGNLFHAVLQGFSDGLKAEGTDWRSLDRDEIQRRTEKCVDDVIPASFNEIMAADPQFQYTVKRVKDIMDRSVAALCSHVRAGRFRPAEFETEFGKNGIAPIVFLLEDGKRITLNGKIDRVDILSVDKNDYVKIIDYKSSEHDFSAEELYYGLQLQLVLYMESYIDSHKNDKGRNMLPGGMFYFKVSNPFVEDNGHGEDIEKMVLEQYDMNGIVLGSDELIDAIGRREPVKKSEKIETLGSVRRTDAAGFEKLCADAVKIAKLLGHGILDGDIDIHPSKCGDKTGCDYCAYSAVCRFDMRENKAYREEPLNIDEEDK